MEKTTVLILFAVAGIALYLWLNAEYQYRQLLRAYATRIDPIVVISKSKRDDTVEIRAEYHREMLRRSGNRWNVPVYAYPYADLYRTGSEFLDFQCDYLVKAGRFAEEVRNQFSLNLKTMDSAAFTQYVAGQRPAMQNLNQFEK